MLGRGGRARAGELGCTRAAGQPVRSASEAREPTSFCPARVSHQQPFNRSCLARSAPHRCQGGYKAFHRACPALCGGYVPMDHPAHTGQLKEAHKAVSPLGCACRDCRGRAGRLGKSWLAEAAPARGWEMPGCGLKQAPGRCPPGMCQLSSLPRHCSQVKAAWARTRRSFEEAQRRKGRRFVVRPASAQEPPAVGAARHSMRS